MPTAAKEVFRDDYPLMTGTHDGTDSSSVLRDASMRFKCFGASVGLYIENETQSTSGLIESVSDSGVVAAGTGGDYIVLDQGEFPYTFGEGTPLTWDNGDTYSIYRTASKNSFISSVWTDVSRGWKINKRDDITRNGWRRKDVDLDEPNRRKVFGPGQPE